MTDANEERETEARNMVTMRTAKTMSRPTDFTTVACSMRSDPKKTAYFNNLRYAKRDNNDSTFCAFCKS